MVSEDVEDLYQCDMYEVFIYCICPVEWFALCTIKACHCSLPSL